MTPPEQAGLVIREAVAADAGRLAQLLAEGALTAREDVADVGAYRSALEEISATPGSAVLVAELDGRVVGCCQLFVVRHLQERGGRCAEVESVHVDAEVRDHGIGTALLAEAVRRARAAGCYRVQLTSNLARQDAHRWYRRLGFAPSHTGFKLYLDERGQPGPGLGGTPT